MWLKSKHFSGIWGWKLMAHCHWLPQVGFQIQRLDLNIDFNFKTTCAGLGEGKYSISMDLK